MPTLDEKQRQWLDAALQAKGRFTRAKSIRKDFEEYQRRRAKTATALEGLAPNAPQRPIVEQALNDADTLAEAGKFSNAYKKLDSAKKLAVTASPLKIDAIATTAMTDAVQDIHDKLYNIIPISDYALSLLDTLDRKMDRVAKVGDQPTLEAAIQRRKDLMGEEIALVGELKGAKDEAREAMNRIRAHNVRDLIAAAEEKVTMYEKAGLGDKISNQKGRLATLKTEANDNGGRYVDANVIGGHLSTRTSGFETKLRAIKDPGRWQDRTGNDAKDGPTDNVRKDLEATNNLDWIAEDADYKVEQAKVAMNNAGKSDKDTLADTDRGSVHLAPEPKKFDPDLAFDSVYNGEIPDDITPQQTDQIVTKATQNMRDFIATADPSGEEMFDLMMMSKKDLARMANNSLTGVDSERGISESHKLMLAKLSEELYKTVLAASPNKVADDLSEVTIGGKKYTREADLGKGGFGIARRFRSVDDPSQTIVVKSLTVDEPEEWDEKRDEMAREMRINQRLAGADDNNPGEGNLLSMSDAAVSGDGTLHMVMEDAAGGDVSGFAKNLNALTDFGFMPPEARDVLSRDMLQQTLMGMKALEERGLVHNDMKPENMLLTGDGKVKIMDFGESRFGDASGEAPSYRAAYDGPDKFNTTPGFDAPEQFDRSNQTVTSKSDTFALGGIAKILMGREYSTDPLHQDMKEETALGRLSSAARDPDPDKRPSLDAMLGSTFLKANETDHPKEDIEDLRAAAVDMSMIMGAVRIDVSPDNLEMPDLFADEEETKEYTDLRVEIDKVINNLNSETASLGKLQGEIANLQSKQVTYTKDLAKASSETRGAVKNNLDLLDKSIKFLATRLKDGLKAAHDTGQKQIDDIANDPDQTIDVPGTGGGKMTMKAAIAKRDTIGREIRLMQDDFYRLSEVDPETALENLDETNRRLTEMAGQITAINTTLKERVGPEGKFLLAEKHLKEVSGRFGQALGRGANTEAKDELADEDIDMDQIFDKDEVVDEIEKRAQG